MAEEGAPAPPWSRLRPLPVVFVALLFVFLWWRAPQGANAPSTASAEAIAPTGGVERQSGVDCALLAGRTMGAGWHATVVGVADAAQAQALAAAAQGVLDKVDASMSTYKSESELSRLNRAAAGEPQPVSRDLAAVLQIALEVSQASDYAFDVAVAPLVDAWGFGPSPPGAAPTAAKLQALRQSAGPRAYSLRLGAGPDGGAALVRARDGVKLDLSAVAPGYATDLVAAELRRRGHKAYLVEVGGEVVVAGLAPGGRPWQLGVEAPDAPPGTVYKSVPMVDEALATSGDYRNSRVIDGESVSHTIDPTTGAPITHGLASISVLHDDAGRADAWATALNVLGAERGGALARAQGIAAMVLLRKPDGGFEEQRSPAWEARQAQVHERARRHSAAPGAQP